MDTSYAELASDIGVDASRTSRHRLYILLLDMKRERWIAVLLAFFLGWIGAHKFYLGQPGWGVLYLIFSGTGVPWLIALFEGIYYILMGYDEFHSKYNN